MSRNNILEKLRAMSIGTFLEVRIADSDTGRTSNIPRMYERVPGGWIHTRNGTETTTQTFIPEPTVPFSEAD